MMFTKKGKLSPRYVGPFKVIERTGEVAYRLAFSPTLSKLYDIFHVSMLKKYLYETSYVLSYESLGVHPKLTYKEKPVKILNQKDKVLRNKIVSLTKMLWHNHAMEEATWKIEEEMLTSYPELF